MGAWLGFHDGETPLMAKLAVHDPGSDTYIFVNRQGIKMREIGGPGALGAQTVGAGPIAPQVGGRCASTSMCGPSSVASLWW